MKTNFETFSVFISLRNENREAGYPPGETLKIVSSKISTLSWAVLLQSNVILHGTHAGASRVENSAQV